MCASARINRLVSNCEQVASVCYNTAEKCAAPNKKKSYSLESDRGRSFVSSYRCFDKDSACFLITTAAKVCLPLVHWETEKFRLAVGPRVSAPQSMPIANQFFRHCSNVCGAQKENINCRVHEKTCIESGRSRQIEWQPKSAARWRNK